MKVEIKKSKVFGRIKAPSSKSWTHRALILAALAKGKSRIISPLSSDDTEATIDCLRKIGVKIKKPRSTPSFLQKGGGLRGRGKAVWEVSGGNFLPPKEPLFCRESGTTLRLMFAICALVKGKCVLTGEKSLMGRPIKPLLEALKKLGVKCVFKKNSIIIENNLAPLEKNSLTGLLGGKTEIRGDVSSQFISALLLIAPFAKKDVEIKLTTPLESKPYLLMTIEAQKKFGVRINYSKDLRRFWVKRQNYKPTNYVVEGDWSSAAPFLAAGIIAGKVAVENLNLKSQQADKEIISVLKKMGGSVKIKKDCLSLNLKNSEIKTCSILVEKSELKPVKFNVQDCPDLFPIICVLAATARGNPSSSPAVAGRYGARSEISGIERLRLKESNRLEEMRQSLNKMGIRAYLEGERFFIEGGKPKGEIIETRDHRIAMAFAILGLVAEGKTIIKNAECVSKSFPEFFDVLGNLRKKFYRQG